MANIIVLINLVIFIRGLVVADPCGDWTSYRDDKCFKVFDTLTPFSGAAQVCQSQGATIGIIRSAEEQGLVVANLKNQSIVDIIWIGIKKSGKSFVSLDGNALKYSLWANGRPLNQTDIECVELSVDDQDKWLDVNCKKNNAVLCEKVQVWDNLKIKNVLVQIKKNYSERMDLLETDLKMSKMEIVHLKRNQTRSINLIDKQQKELEQIKQSPVPIGFIYVQLSGQSEPHTLWPQTEWNNISQNYSGLFFRAEGGKAATFGQIQGEQSRSLQIYNGQCTDNPNGYSYFDFVYNKTSYTVNTKFYEKTFFTGINRGTGHALVQNGNIEYGINFRYNTDENRPSNQAIRIWIRIK